MALQSFGGKDVILNELMTQTKSETVDRSIMERLFSRPWNPMKKTKVILKTVPSRECYITGSRVIMHPAMWEEIRKIKGDL